MLVMFYYEKDGIVQLMNEYAGYPFCTYQDVEGVKYLSTYDVQWQVKMRNGDIAIIKPDIFETRVN